MPSPSLRQPLSAYMSRDQWYFFRNYLFMLYEMKSIISIIQPSYTADNTHVYPPRYRCSTVIADFSTPCAWYFSSSTSAKTAVRMIPFALFYSTVKSSFADGPVFIPVQIHASTLCILLLNFLWTLSLTSFRGIRALLWLLSWIPSRFDYCFFFFFLPFSVSLCSSFDSTIIRI
jgi:hypothetical protein